MPTDVKELLYSVIDEIGREKIRADVSANIKKSESYSREIIAACVNRLGSEAADETLATTCEALLHFMLTVSILPSERKVNAQGADLDIVIPSTRLLSKSPEKSLVIQVIRGDLAAKVGQAESIQPHRENIWLVSAHPLLTGYRNYHIESYPRIISDIDVFLLEKGDSGLRLLP